MKLYFRNLSCAGCALDIEWELSQLDSVRSVQVDLMQSVIDIEFEGDTASMRQTIERIGKSHESGFELVPEEDEEAKKREALWQKLNYLMPRVVLSLLFLLLGSLYERYPLFILAYLLTGGDVLWRAGQRLLRRDIFHEYFLMSTATLGAFVIGEYQEAVAVMLFYQIGEYLQDKAITRSKESIEALMKQRVPLARVLREGNMLEVDPADVAAGEQILVRPGEEVPLDGILIQGSSSVNNAAITGESLPQALVEGGEVTAGAINLDGAIKLEVTRIYQDSGMARVLRLMRDAKSKKPPTERFISRFARRYTKVVVLLAPLVALLPVLLAGGDLSTYVYRALIFLVVSCPCALVISVPLGFFAGMGGFSKNNLLIKNPEAIEQLSRVRRIAFDKTNTLTEGQFRLKRIESQGMVENLLLRLIRSVEEHSNHPLARAVVQADAEHDGAILEFETVTETAGLGLEAVRGEVRIHVGSAAWLASQGVTVPDLVEDGTYIYAARNGEYLGRILLEDSLKADAPACIAALRRQGVNSLVMLTGDNEVHAKSVADELGLDSYEAGLKPEGKLDWLEERVAQPGGNLAFVGDGINDAPGLVAADVGVAMGIKGTDLAIQAAQLVVMQDRIADLPTALVMAKRVMRVIRQNIVFAIGFKVLVMLLGFVGLANLWMAVFADMGVTLLAVLNSMRLLK